MKKTEFRFKLLRIRTKLSFMAYQRDMTIIEMILNQILTTSRKMEKDGMIYKDPSFTYEALSEDDALVSELLNPWEVKSFVTLIQLNLKN